MDRFHDEIRLFNFWAWVQRHMRDKEGGSLNLSTVDQRVIFSVDLEEVRASYSLALLDSFFPERQPVLSSEITVAEAWFEARDPRLACSVFNPPVERVEFACITG
jgi:hypothetical protein